MSGSSGYNVNSEFVGTTKAATVRRFEPTESVVRANDANERQEKCDWFKSTIVRSPPAVVSGHLVIEPVGVRPIVRPDRK